MICVILPMDDDAAAIIALWWEYASNKPEANLLYRPTREQVTSAMRDAPAIFYFGHGSEDAWITQDSSIRLADSENIGSARGSLVIAMACFSLTQLGTDAIERGVRTYIGCSKRLATIRASREFAVAGASAVSVLCSGGNASQFVEAMQGRFSLLNEYYRNGAGRRLPNSTIHWVAAARNSKCIDFKGDPTATLL